MLRTGVSVLMCLCASGILVHGYRDRGPAGSVDNAVARLEVAAGPVHRTSGVIYYPLHCKFIGC